MLKTNLACKMTCIFSATSAYEVKRQTKHKMDLDKRKKRVESQQANDIQNMLNSQKSKDESDKFRKHVIGMYRYMRRDEFLVTKGKAYCYPLWVCLVLTIDKLPW